MAADTVAELAADVVGLLDDVGAEQAVLVGHGFGAVVAWTAPVLHPERFSAVAGLSLPPVPRPKVPTTQAFRRIFGDNFFYVLYFQEPGPADAELDEDPATTLRCLFATPAAGDDAGALRMLAPGPDGFLARIPEPGGLPDWISAYDFAVYVDEFTRTGFTGSLNWYRCFDRNWELTATRVPGPSTCPPCSSAVPPTPPWRTRRGTAPVRSSPASTAR